MNFLQRLSVVVMMIGNRLDILALDLRYQPTHVLLCQFVLLAAHQAGRERLDKSLQPAQHPLLFRLDDRVVQQFLQSNLIVSFHRRLPFRQSLPEDRSMKLLELSQ
jgi:hypothetical protein